ncbi:MAG: hypothetical protein ACOC5T_02675 [Elusimicrobiota bacterium]
MADQYPIFHLDKGPHPRSRIGFGWLRLGKPSAPPAPPSLIIWHSDLNADKIYKLNTSGSILDSFASPSSTPVGVGVDSDGCIWNMDRSSKIYKMNQSGSIISSFTGSAANPTGLDIDANDYIWYADRDGTGTIYKSTREGTVLDSWGSPSSVPQGVDMDSNGCIWVADQGNIIHKCKQDGSIISSFTTPDYNYGLSIDNNDCLWHIRYFSAVIVQINQSGSLVSSFACPSSGYRGVGVEVV